MLCQVACRVLRSECESVNCEHRTACTQPWIGALHRRDMGATTGLKSYERLLTRSTLLSTCVYCIYVRAAAAGALTRGEWSNGREPRGTPAYDSCTCVCIETAMNGNGSQRTRTTRRRARPPQERVPGGRVPAQRTALSCVKPLRLAYRVRPTSYSTYSMGDGDVLITLRSHPSGTSQPFILADARAALLAIEHVHAAKEVAVALL